MINQIVSAPDNRPPRNSAPPAQYGYAPPGQYQVRLRVRVRVRP